MPPTIFNGQSMVYIDADHLLHRTDGPAVEYTEGPCEGQTYWWFHGIFVPVKSQKEFELYMILKAFW